MSLSIHIGLNPGFSFNGIKYRTKQLEITYESSCYLERIDKCFNYNPVLQYQRIHEKFLKQDTCHFVISRWGSVCTIQLIAKINIV